MKSYSNHCDKTNNFHSLGYIWKFKDIVMEKEDGTCVEEIMDDEECYVEEEDKKMNIKKILI